MTKPERPNELNSALLGRGRRIVAVPRARHPAIVKPKETILRPNSHAGGNHTRKLERGCFKAPLWRRFRNYHGNARRALLHA